MSHSLIIEIIEKITGKSIFSHILKCDYSKLTIKCIKKIKKILLYVKVIDNIYETP